MDKYLELTYNLLSRIGIDISNDGTLIDQDFSTVIQINGKNAKFSYCDNLNINKNTEILFNPIFNIKQMQMLFSYYLDKLIKLEEITGKANFSPVLERDNKVKIILLITEHGNINASGYDIIRSEPKITTYESKSYRLHNLGYVELIIKLSGCMSADLTNYDMSDEECNLKKNKNK